MKIGMDSFAAATIDGMKNPAENGKAIARLLERIQHADKSG
jgi:hypothetical protein